MDINRFTNILYDLTNSEKALLFDMFPKDVAGPVSACRSVGEGKSLLSGGFSPSMRVMNKLQRRGIVFNYDKLTSLGVEFLSILNACGNKPLPWPNPIPTSTKPILTKCSSARTHEDLNDAVDVLAQLHVAPSGGNTDEFRGTVYVYPRDLITTNGAAVVAISLKNILQDVPTPIVWDISSLLGWEESGTKLKVVGDWAGKKRQVEYKKDLFSIVEKFTEGFDRSNRFDVPCGTLLRSLKDIIGVISHNSYYATRYVSVGGALFNPQLLYHTIYQLYQAGVGDMTIYPNVGDRKLLIEGISFIFNNVYAVIMGTKDSVHPYDYQFESFMDGLKTGLLCLGS